MEYWSTHDEIKFIKRTTPPLGLTRLKFLQNYKEGIQKRVDWDILNKEEIEVVLNQEIEKELENYGGNS